MAGTKLKNPTTKDYDKLLVIVRYIHKYRNLGLVFCRHKDASMKNGIAKIDRNKVIMKAFADASFNIYPEDSKSQTGFLIVLSHNGAPIEATSCKQKRVTLASTEAEHESLFTLIKRILWWRCFLDDIGFQQKDGTVIYEDNKSTITLALHPNRNQKRSKHYILRIHYIHDVYKNREINVEWIHTKRQRADGLTKCIKGKGYGEVAKTLLGYDDIQGNDDDDIQEDEYDDIYENNEI